MSCLSSLEFARGQVELCRFTVKAAVIALEVASGAAEVRDASEACIGALRQYKAARAKLAFESRVAAG